MRRTAVWSGILFCILAAGSCAGLMPVSLRVADRLLVTRPYDPRFTPIFVLLVLPDSIEIRRVDTLSAVSPRPDDAPYRFRIPHERLAQVEEQVKAYPSPNRGDASWLIDVQELSTERQRIQLELFGDGIYGLVYEATDREVLPVSVRSTGPGFMFAVILINCALWGVLWVPVLIYWRVKRRRVGTSAADH